MTTFVRPLARIGWIAAFSLASGSALSQIADQLVLYATDANLAPVQNVVYRFDRKLDVLGYTSMTAMGAHLSVSAGMGVSSAGLYSLPVDIAVNSVKKVLRLAPDGSIPLETDLAWDPQSVRVGKDGTAYALTWGGAFTPGDAYAVKADGTILWSNIQGPSIYATPADDLAITPAGHLWIGGHASGFSGGFFWTPVIQLLDPQTGNVIRQTELPPLGLTANPAGPGDTFLVQLEAAPDGTLWAMLSGLLFPQSVVQTDGVNALKVFQPSGGWNGNTNQLRIDAAGDLYTVSFWTEDGEYGGQIRKFSQEDGSLLAVYSMTKGFSPSTNPQASVASFALGATGEDAYAVVMTPVNVANVVRVNLVTGVRSMRRFPNFSTPTVPPGDPTGFIYANVIDQDGDNDGDGYTNREETLAGTHPFRAQSRPGGPKVYLSFLAGSNAIVLAFKDPDGLLDPVGGLDLASLSLVASGMGEILPLLWPFVSKVDLSADGKEATVEFGNLPIPSGLQVSLEATVRDRQGLEGWDWQVTPPGVLE